MSSNRKREATDPRWLQVRADPAKLEKHRAANKSARSKYQYSKKNWEKTKADPELYAEHLRKRAEYRRQPEQRERKRNSLKALWAKTKADPVAREKKNAAALERYRRVMTAPEGAARLRRIGWVACLKRYGLTPERYEVMRQEQNGKCAICGTPEQGHPLCVDHCHASGRIRGLLCKHCNSGLGYFHDDREAIRNAIQYLSRHVP